MGKHKMLMGQDRLDHIAELRSAMAPAMARMALRLGRRLSLVEAYAVMIGAIEDRARCDAARIKVRAQEVGEKCGITPAARPTVSPSQEQEP